MRMLISVGEASGDMHAASALQELTRKYNGNIESFGMGGKKLAACGMELLVDNRHHSVMGLVEVLHKYPQLRANLNSLKKAIKEKKPDVVLLVDYPHFNMKLATEAKKLGVPVLYYIAPKVWASRSGRTQELKNIVDHMAVIFPFEVDIFQQVGIPTSYVGNPILQNQALMSARNSAKTGLRVALLPGSRKSEINNLLTPMLDAAKLLTDKHPEVSFVLPVAETIDQKHIADSIEGHNLNIEMIDASDYEKVSQCRAAMVSSGTATLELAIMGVPMVVAYRMNTLSYTVLKRWLTIEYISLVNIIAQHEVVPELLQDNATAAKLFEQVSPLLDDNSDKKAQQLQGFDSVYDTLCAANVNTSLASLLVSLVKKHDGGGNLKFSA